MLSKEYTGVDIEPQALVDKIQEDIGVNSITKFAYNADIKKLEISLDIENIPSNVTLLDGLVNGHDPVEQKKRKTIKKQAMVKYNKHEQKIRTYEEQKKLVDAGMLDATDITEQKYLKILEMRNKLRNFWKTCNPDNPEWPIEE
jgi:hypothetical protein